MEKKNVSVTELIAINRVLGTNEDIDARREIVNTLHDVRKNYKLLAGGNSKLGKTIGTFSKLYVDGPFYIQKLDLTANGSCGGFCGGCKEVCYVRKSYRYPSVVYGHAINTLAMRNDIEKLFADIDLQLARKRKPFKVVRINQSGELESVYEFLKWLDLAGKHPETVFYIYTKAFTFVVDTLLAIGENLPDNFITLISVWHEYGINEFNSVKHLKTVKAFIYIDKNFGVNEYAARGLSVKCFCPAYDEHGKMDKRFSCDVCQACHNLKAPKVIGCFDHN